MKLKDTFLRAVKPEAKAKKYADGEGLYLLVKPNGAMLWRYDFRLKDGARKTASFGKYPDVSSLRRARSTLTRANWFRPAATRQPPRRRRGKRPWLSATPAARSARSPQSG
jgi:hypothetical protein